MRHTSFLVCIIILFCYPVVLINYMMALLVVHCLDTASSHHFPACTASMHVVSIIPHITVRLGRSYHHYIIMDHADTGQNSRFEIIWLD